MTTQKHDTVDKVTYKRARNETGTLFCNKNVFDEVD